MSCVDQILLVVALAMLAVALALIAINGLYRNYHRRKPQ